MALWVLLALVVFSVGGCFLVGGAGCAIFSAAVEEVEGQERMGGESGSGKEEGDQVVDD